MLLRLDRALSSGGVTHDLPIITVEHVLPQNPSSNSSWTEVFTPDQRAHWVHRLANLVLLTRRKNSGMGNKDFAIKKSGYFTGATGATPFALTSQILGQGAWTPGVLEARPKELIFHLQGLWRL